MCLWGMHGQQRPRSDCPDVLSEQDHHCPLPVPLDTIECIKGFGKQRSGPSCSKLAILLVNVSLKL